MYTFVAKPSMKLEFCSIRTMCLSFKKTKLHILPYKYIIVMVLFNSVGYNIFCISHG